MKMKKEKKKNNGHTYYTLTIKLNEKFKVFNISS